MNNLDADLLQLLRDLLTQLPSLLILLVCFTIAIVRWKRHPKASLIAALGLAAIFFQGLFYTIAYFVINRLVVGSGGYQEHLGLYNRLALLSNFLFAIGLGTLLTAVFIGRRQRLG